MAKRLFMKVEESERRSVRLPLLLTLDESEKIRQSASIRDMSAAEFCRRAALGRKADVHYETQIVLELSDATRAIRELHAGLVERGITPPEEAMQQLIADARNAMLRISK